MKIALTLAAMGLLAGCGNPKAPEGNTQPPNVPATFSAGTDGQPPAFAQCTICHSVAPDGLNGIGPNLRRVAGAKAGGVKGYSYSPAMTTSGLTWNDAALDAWIANPRAILPGTKMSYGGMPDAAQRQAIIAYLKTLK